MRQKAQKDRRFSVLWEWVLKAVSVFAFKPSTLVGLVFLIVLMQFLGVNGSFYNDESSSSDVTSGYELSHTIGHAAASSLAMLLLGNYFSRHIIEKGNSPKGRPKGSKNRRWQHKTVSALFDEYGPIFFRRAFRMGQKSFWTLLDLIERQQQKQQWEQTRNNEKKQRQNNKEVPLAAVQKREGMVNFGCVCKII